MDFSEEETRFICPYCGESISMIMDQYHGPQEYIEDCEVCCRPIQIKYKIDDFSITHLDISRLDD